MLDGKLVDIMDPVQLRPYLKWSHIKTILQRIERWGCRSALRRNVYDHSRDVASQFTSLRLRKAALLHDAAEAFIGDIPRPIKNIIPLFKLLEGYLQSQIEDVYHLPSGSLTRIEIKRADSAAMLDELNESKRLLRSQL